MTAVASLVASARMYAVTPAAADAWRALFERVAIMADVPLVYVEHPAPAPLEDLWRRPDLGLAFMCGYPFARATPQPIAVAAPLPSGERYAGRPVYWTDFVVRAGSPYATLSDTFGTTIGWTVEHSQSGFNAVRRHLAGLRPEGGAALYVRSVGHLVTARRSLEAVLDGTVEVGPLDSYWHALLRLFEPQTAARVRVVERTAPTPMPLLVASPGTDGGIVARLRAALLSLPDDPDGRALLAALGLAGFAAVAADHYRVLIRQADEAEAAGYPIPT